MISILLFHIFVALITMSFAQIGVKIDEKTNSQHKLNYGCLVSFFILLFFLGGRTFVGKDWFHYEDVFISPWQRDFIAGESTEFGFLLLNNFLRSSGASFQSLIFLTSFLTLFFFYIFFRKCYYLLPFGIFIFFVDWGYPVVINTIRQGIALMVFLNAALYIDSDEKHSAIKFLFFVLLGLLFHYTILLFIPFFFIGRLKIHVSKFLAICIMVFLLSIIFVLPAFEETLAIVDKYESYIDSNQMVNDKSTFGLGATLVLIIRLAPLLVYEHVRKAHPELLKYFVLYYLGLSVYYGFYNYLLIIRITFYLQFFALLVLSYFLYYLFVERKDYRLIGIAYVSVILFNYIYTFKGFLLDQVVNSNFSLMFMDFYFKVD